MSRACSCCSHLFEDAELTQRQNTRGYASRTVYYCVGCIEKKNQQAKLQSLRTTYRKSVNTRAYR